MVVPAVLFRSPTSPNPPKKNKKKQKQKLRSRSVQFNLACRNKRRYHPFVKIVNNLQIQSIGGPFDLVYRINSFVHQELMKVAQVFCLL